MKIKKIKVFFVYTIGISLGLIFFTNEAVAATVLCKGPDNCGPGPAPCPQGLTQVPICMNGTAPATVLCEGPDNCGAGTAPCPQGLKQVDTCEQVTTGNFCQGPDGCGGKPATGCPTGFTPVSACPNTDTGGAMTGGTVFTNPLAFDTVEGFLSHFLTVLQQIIVTLSLVFIVVGAVMYIISAGNSGMVEKAKGAITASLIGLALGIAAPSFLKEISFVLGWGPTGSAEVDQALTLTQIALNVLNFLLAAVGILSILMMVLGGAMYLTSAGNEDRIQSGKNIAKNAIIGIIISLSAMVLVRQIAEFFAR